MRLLLAVLALLVLPGSAAAATLHTDPLGTGTACSEAIPCTIEQAFTSAVDGDTIAVGAGVYASPTQRNLTDSVRDLTITGVTGTGRPIIQNATLTLLGSDSRVTDVDVRAPGGFALTLSNGAEADRVFAKNADGVACQLSGGVLSNSVCLGTLEGLRVNGTVNQAVRNVTAKGTTGARFASTGITLAANSILVGTGSFDHELVNGNINFANVNYSTSNTLDPGPTEFNEVGTQTAEPVFFGGDDFRQFNSPTTDAGVTNQAQGTYDLNGNLRTLGTKTDIGAFENVPDGPNVSTIFPDEVTPHTATIYFDVDTNGGATTSVVSYGQGGLGSDAPPVFTPGMTDVTTESVVLTGLQSKTTYKFNVALNSDGGSVTPGGTFEFTTPPEPLVPIVGATTAITATSATVNGTVDSDGQGYIAAFRVTPPSGPAITPPPHSSPDDASLSDDITGLAPATTYTVELLASYDEVEVVTSPAGSFTTLPEAPAATVGDATDVTATSATLTGSGDLKQAATGKARFVLAGADQPEQDTTGGTVTQAVTGLTPGTTYEYKLRVQTTGGTVESTAKSFTTAAAPPAASPTPSPQPSASPQPSPSASPTPTPSAACTKAQSALAKAKQAAKKAAKAVKKAKTAKKKKAAKAKSKKAKARVKKAKTAVGSAC